MRYVEVSERIMEAAIRSWDGWQFRDNRRSELLPNDTIPLRTASGAFLLYHGTTLSRAEHIRTHGFQPDNIGRIGFGTRYGAVTVFAFIKRKKDDPPVVISVILPERVIRNGMFEREGNHRDLWLFSGADGRPTTIPATAFERFKVSRI